MIIGSDLIYHKDQLELVPRFIKKLSELFVKEIKCPLFVMSYKSRDEIIDTNLFRVFDEIGFDGEQADGKELDEEYINEPIDIFHMWIKEFQPFI